MACNRPWCLKCLKEETPVSKIKERLKMKLEKKKEIDFVSDNTNTTDIKRLMVNFENMQGVKLCVANKKPHLKFKKNDNDHGRKPIDFNQQKSKSKEPPINIQKAVDFIEGIDREAELAKKQKNLAKRVRRRERILLEKEAKDKQEPDVAVEPKEPEQNVQNLPKFETNKFTINHESKEDSITLTLSLTGSSVLIEKIISSVVQTVPEVKNSIINAAKNDSVSEKINGKQKKSNKKKSVKNVLSNSEVNKAPNSERATFLKRENGMVIIKRPEMNTMLNSRNYKIEEVKPQRDTKTVISSKKTFIKNKENCDLNDVNANENLKHILHDLPEITIQKLSS